MLAIKGEEVEQVKLMVVLGVEEERRRGGKNENYEEQEPAADAMLLRTFQDAQISTCSIFQSKCC